MLAGTDDTVRKLLAFVKYLEQPKEWAPQRRAPRQSISTDPCLLDDYCSRHPLMVGAVVRERPGGSERPTRVAARKVADVRWCAARRRAEGDVVRSRGAIMRPGHRSAASDRD